MISMLGIIRRRLRLYPFIYIFIIIDLYFVFIRDEILCQICKQLNDHPALREKKSRNREKAEQRERSYMRGWFLLCICLYTFPPGSNVSSNWFFCVSRFNLWNNHFPLTCF